MRRTRLFVVAAVVAAAVVMHPLVGALAASCGVGGAIGAYWRSVGADRSFLGACITDEQLVPGGVVQRFVVGSVYWSPPTGARSVHGEIEVAYDRVQGPSSVLGLPLTSEQPTPGGTGAYNHFLGGSIYWSPPTGAKVVRGAILERWATTGWERGVLGFPTTSEAPTPWRPGAYSHFQGGSVYWSPATGAEVVRGAILQRWAETGWEQGLLGFPTTSESATPRRPGAYSHFQGGSVYWSPHTDAHVVVGTIRARWAELGWESSALGFPTSDEYAVPGGRRSEFEGGTIDWDAATGSTVVRPRFTSSVFRVVAADLPASYRPGCPVLPQDLRLLRMTYLDLAGTGRTGEMVVHADVVATVVDVFSRLHAAGFPVARMDPVDAFGGSDDASMAANNTSAFNCRPTTGGSGWSEHAYGRALDLNPVQNPYVSGSTVLPGLGRAYLDRSNRRPGMVTAGDLVVTAFAASGWGWGGGWTSARDYQHFSSSGR